VTSVRGRRKDDEATDQRGHPARGSERVRERAGDGWGRLAIEREAGCGAGWRARGGRPKMRRARRSAGAWKGEVVGLGRDSVQQGEEKAFLFFFLLSNSYFPFCPFFF
jgi:hypothetical protein